MIHRSSVYVGCAGWSIPRDYADRFPAADAGTHLERYAQRLSSVEINSSFYKANRPETYRRWAESVPPGFRFSVKMPREITHRRRLRECEALLAAFLAETAALGPKLGPLLVQLPPGLSFEAPVVTAFFAALREVFAGGIVCEPRHVSWIAPEADETLREFHVARVVADPALSAPGATEPGGWDGIAYYRLHGSPRVYYSDYGEDDLEALASRLTRATTGARSVWCIFDNTALGAATANALRVEAILGEMEETRMTRAERTGHP